MQKLYQWEKRMLLKLNGSSHPFMDRVMMLLTGMGNGGLIWIVAGLVLMGTGWRMEGILMLASLGETAVLINLVIKPLFTRKRPYEILHSIRALIRPPFGSSFPSGHAASSFAAASMLWFLHTPFRYMALVTAFLIAISRIYLLVHFPSDVLAGMVSGVVISYLTYLLVLRMGMYGVWDKLGQLSGWIGQAKAGWRQVAEQGARMGMGLWDFCMAHGGRLS